MQRFQVCQDEANPNDKNYLSVDLFFRRCVHQSNLFELGVNSVAIYLNDRNRNRIVPMKRLELEFHEDRQWIPLFSNLLDTDLYNF